MGSLHYTQAAAEYYSHPQNDCFQYYTCSHFLYFVPCFTYHILPCAPQTWYSYPFSPSISMGDQPNEEDEARETEVCRRPKSSKRRRNKVAPSADHELNEEEAAGRGLSKTTVMIKNIPNNLVMKKLLDLLDEHCRDVNVGLGEGSGAASEFDFLYLPMDFRTGNNLGYAFVNFTTPLAAWRLYQQLHMKSWADLGSAKVCHVNYARIQGLRGLLRHFKGSRFRCDSDDYLPVRFSPSRDGFRRTAREMVGKFVAKPRGVSGGGLNLSVTLSSSLIMWGLLERERYWQDYL